MSRCFFFFFFFITTTATMRNTPLNGPWTIVNIVGPKNWHKPDKATSTRYIYMYMTEYGLRQKSIWNAYHRTIRMSRKPGHQSLNCGTPHTRPAQLLGMKRSLKSRKAQARRDASIDASDLFPIVLRARAGSRVGRHLSDGSGCHETKQSL